MSIRRSPRNRVIRRRAVLRRSADDMLKRQASMGSVVLVTGGAGFIGSNLVHALLADGSNAKVVCFDALTYAGNLDNHAELAGDPRFVFVRGDVADRAAVRAVFADHRPDLVFNLAAESHVDRSIDAPGAFVRTNLVGTFEMLEAARAHHACLDADARERFRFIHVSTDEVFGSLGEVGRFHEESRYQPNSPYAASKAGADHLVRAYVHTYRLPAITTNCSNNYGAYQFPEKLIPLVTLNALEGKHLPVYGDGKNVRDWLFVGDHCAALMSVAKRGSVGETYNVGGDSEKTTLEVVGAVCDVLDRRAPKSGGSYRSQIELVKDRPGHDRRYAIDATKIRRELGWGPTVAFEEGIDRTVAWYLEHRAWCDRVARGVYNRERLGLGEGARA